MNVLTRLLSRLSRFLPPTATSSPLEAGQTKLLFDNFRIGAIAILLNAAFLTIAQWAVVSHRAAGAWLGYMLLVLGARTALWLAYRHASAEYKATIPWKHWYVIGSTATGLGWGAASFVLYPADSFFHQLFLTFVIAGMTAGAVTALSPVFSAYLVSAGLSLGPLIGRLIWEGQDLHGLMGGMATLFFLATTVAARNMNQAIATGLALRFQNHDLTQTLARNEEQLRLLHDAGPSMFFTLNEAGTVMTANRLALESLGYSSDDLIGRSLLSLVREEDRPTVAERLAALMKQPLPVQRWQARMTTRNGDEVWVEADARAIRGPGDTLIIFMVGQDVSERTRAETALRDSQELVTSILENLPAMVFVKDAKDLRFVRFNKAGEELIGHSRSDLLGKTDYDFFPKEEADFFTQKDREVLAGSRLLDIPAEPIQTKDRGTRYLHTKKIPLRDAQGHARYLLGISEDITEQRAARERLALYREIIAKSTDAICIIDLQGHYIEQNAANRRLLGYSDEEIRGKTPALHLGAAQFAAFMEALSATGQFRGEVVSTTRSGSQVPIDVTAFTVRDAEGRPVCHVGIKRDITERKLAETRWRRSQSELEQRVVERTAELTAAYNTLQKEVHERERVEQRLRGSAERTIRHQQALLTLAKEQATRSDRGLSTLLRKLTVLVGDTLGVSRASVWLYGEDRSTIACEDLFQLESRTHERGATLTVNLAPTYFKALEESSVLAIADAQSEARTAELLEDYLLPLGITSVLDAPIRLDGKMIGVLCCEHVGPMRQWAPEDLSFASEVSKSVSLLMQSLQRRHLEDQFRQAQKLEAIGRLAGGIAHDFNNMLTVVLGYCGLILQQCSPDDPKHRQILEIQRAGERAMTLTRQLLTFSRKQVVQPRLVNLTTLVEDLTKMLKRLIGEDVELLTVFNHGTWLVRADPGQLEQAIVNLAVNARDAMPHGGRLTVEVGHETVRDQRPIESGVLEPGEYVTLTMTDTGTGMPPEVRSQIFEPFFTTKDPGKGTGLGLAMVHGAVIQCGGAIEVHTQEGNGSSFRLYFPKADTGLAGKPAAAVTLPSTRGTEAILLVEDDATVRELARETLITQGYSVYEVGNGQEAIDFLEKSPAKIDLLVSDTIMPKMGGTELFRRLAAARPDLKILLMSGYSSEECSPPNLESSAVAFLQKPFSPTELCGKIRELLDGRRPETPQSELAPSTERPTA